MRRTSIRILASLIAVTLVTTLSGCQEKSPEEKVAATRSEYFVKLNTWKVREPPAPPEDAMAAGSGDEMAGDEMAGDEMAATEDPSAEGSGEVEGTEGETMSEPAAGPSPATILIDLIVRFDGSEPLPGITVDIAQADPFEKTKASYRHWIETAGMFKRDTRQISFDLEVEDFQVGDVFSVVLESHVAAEDRGEYREFATPATPAP